MIDEPGAEPHREISHEAIILSLRNVEHALLSNNPVQAYVIIHHLREGLQRAL